MSSANWADCLIFLDMFVEQAPYLQVGLHFRLPFGVPCPVSSHAPLHTQREALERVVPYALLRSMYNQVYLGKEDVRASSVSTMRGGPKKREMVDGI